MKKILLLAAVASGLLVACDSLGGSDGGSDGKSDDVATPAGYFTAETGHYIVSGNKIIMTITNKECDENDVLQTITEVDTSTFTIAGDAMTVISDGDTMVMTRVGSGSGLNGTWEARMIDMGMADEMGDSLCSFDSACAAQRAAMMRAYAGLKVRLSMDNGTMQMQMPTSMFILSMRAMFASFSGAGMPPMDITVDTSSSSQIKITGKKSGEVVTISVTAAGDIQWKSSVATHATVTMPGGMSDPVSCPDTLSSEDPPEWFGNFVQANMNLTGYTGRPKPPALRKPGLPF